jgi:hypothetical protein
VEPDAEFPLEFQWKAVKGDHKLEVSVNNQNFSKTVSVAKPTVTPTQPGGDMLVPGIAIAVVVVIAVVAAVMVGGARKKRAGLQEPYDEGYQDQRVEEQYQPQEEEPSPEPEPEAPPMTEEQQAREAIDNAERVLADAEGAGLDTSKSRQSLKIARNFLEMGKYQKAMLYCKMAEDNLG